MHFHSEPFKQSSYVPDQIFHHDISNDLNWSMCISVENRGTVVNELYGSNFYFTVTWTLKKHNLAEGNRIFENAKGNFEFCVRQSSHSALANYNWNTMELQ